MKSPGELEVLGNFSRHLGPRFEAAGLKIQFHYNQPPGIHFKTEAPSEYREWIINGISDGLKARFPEFPSEVSIWIIEVLVHEIDSSQRAFYLAGRMVIDQAFAICSMQDEDAKKRLPNETERKALCELMHKAFIELRYLSGEQARDLAYAFHNLPVEIFGWGNWTPSGTRARLAYYQKKHSSNLGTNYLDLFDKIFPNSRPS